MATFSESPFFGIPEPAAAAAKSLQSCPTLCDPIDDSPSGSAVLGILQARTLEWVAISFSNMWSNMWSTLVISFLQRSKHLLISWIQSPFAVMLETEKINSLTVSIVSPSIWHDVMGTDVMILVFLNVEF